MYISNAANRFSLYFPSFSSYGNNMKTVTWLLYCSNTRAASCAFQNRY